MSVVTTDVTYENYFNTAKTVVLGFSDFSKEALEDQSGLNI